MKGSAHVHRQAGTQDGNGTLSMQHIADEAGRRAGGFRALPHSVHGVSSDRMHRSTSCASVVSKSVLLCDITCDSVAIGIIAPAV